MPVSAEELFLPEPLPREVRYTIISVDDHVVEPDPACATAVAARYGRFRELAG